MTMGSMGRMGSFGMGVSPIGGSGTSGGTADSGRGRQPIDGNNGKASSDATRNTNYSNSGSRQFGAANYGGGGGGLSVGSFMGMGFLGYKTK